MNNLVARFISFLFIIRYTREQKCVHLTKPTKLIFVTEFESVIGFFPTRQNFANFMVAKSKFFAFRKTTLDIELEISKI